MINDIYMRDPGDPLFLENTLDVSNELEVLLGQIRMILFTRPGEVISNVKFGVDLEQYVFSMNLSNSELSSLITRQIYENCPLANNYDISVDVKFFYGSTRDLCVIDIFVDGTKYFGVLLK